MIHWNRKRYRSLLLLQITLLFIFTTAMIATFSESNLPSDLRELQVVHQAHVDLKEISGLALLDGASANPTVMAVGDKEPRLLYWSMDDWHAKSKSFAKVLVDHFSLCRNPTEGRCKKAYESLVRDWEALAVDGQGRIFLVQEYSESLLVLTKDLQSVEAIINYSFAEAFPALKQSKKKFRANSMGEGVILLKEGHFIVAKESDPPALVEFGPSGSKPLGLSAATLLQAGESFRFPSVQDTGSGSALPVTRFDYVPLHSWTYHENGGPAKCDISDLSAFKTGRVFLLSQNCGQLRVLSGLSLGRKDMDFKSVYNVTRNVRNPEALVALSETEVIVASDTKKSGANVFRLRLPEPAGKGITTH